MTDDRASKAAADSAQARNPKAASSATIAPTKALLLSAALQEAGRLADAETILRPAIENDPQNSDLHKARGVAFVKMGRFLEASWCCRIALECNPRDPGAWTNLGNALLRFRQVTGAIGCQRQAAALDEANSFYRYNLGTSLAELWRHEEAIAEFTRALELNPDCHLTRWNRARSYLVLGQYGPGWTDHEARFDGGLVPQRDIPGIKWDGRPCPGRRRITLHPPALPSMQLARVVDIRIQHRFGYPDLFPPRDCISMFAREIERAGKKFKVGIVWSGSAAYDRNEERARTLDRFIQAFALPGVQLHGLHKGSSEKELGANPGSSAIIGLSPLTADFADMAAAIA